MQVNSQRRLVPFILVGLSMLYGIDYSSARTSPNSESQRQAPPNIVLWMGHFNLSTSLGIPGQFDYPQFQEAVEQVLDACRTHNKTAGFLASDIANGRQLLSQGFRILCL